MVEIIYSKILNDLEKDGWLDCYRWPMHLPPEVIVKEMLTEGTKPYMLIGACGSKFRLETVGGHKCMLIKFPKKKSVNNFDETTLSKEIPVKH